MGLCAAVLQVVETNLVAFDCHWILINEVGAVEMMYECETDSDLIVFTFSGEVYSAVTATGCVVTR